jgi:phosphoglycolate phosphatase-like HAD superfamily hydrolase
LNTRTIGFDFDQTLADSQPGISTCLRVLCEEFYSPKEDHLIDKLSISGLSLERMLRELFNLSEIERQKQRFLELYPTLGVPGTKLIPGARELLNYLAADGHHLVLISAKSQRNLDLSVEHLGLKFTAVFGGSSGRDKTRVMMENNTYLYIGDQMSDIEAANFADAKAVLVSEKPLELDFNQFPHIHFHSLYELHKSIHLLVKK